MSDDVKTLVERLRAEELRLQKVSDRVRRHRDETDNPAARERLGDVQHAIDGRDPVAEDAADTIEAQAAEIERLRKELDDAERMLADGE